MDFALGRPDLEGMFYLSDVWLPTHWPEWGEAKLSQHQVADLVVTTGKIVACDGLIPSLDCFEQAVAPGIYPVIISIAQPQYAGSLVAGAMVCFSKERPLSWDIAKISGNDPYCYGVDCGVGCFADLAIMKVLSGSAELWEQYKEAVYTRNGPLDSNHAVSFVVNPADGSNIVVFSSGEGDGCYTSYFGYGKQGQIVCLVTDFGVIDSLPKPEMPYYSRYQLEFDLL